jgi:hypothetical protein
MLRIIGQISLEESDPDELPGIRKKDSYPASYPNSHAGFDVYGRSIGDPKQILVPIVWSAQSICQTDGADLSSTEFTFRYEVAKFSKNEQFSSICLVIGYALKPGQNELLSTNILTK